MKDEARVPVTVEDREAAADAVLAIRGRKDGDWQGRIRKGECDEGVMVQAIAKARLAGVAAGREEACQAIEHRICEGYDVPARKADQCVHGKFGWEDCIACYDDALTAKIAAIRQMGGE